MVASDEYGCHRHLACTSLHAKAVAVPLAAFWIETILTMTQWDELLKFEANHFHLKQNRLSP